MDINAVNTLTSLSPIQWAIQSFKGKAALALIDLGAEINFQPPLLHFCRIPNVIAKLLDADAKLPENKICISSMIRQSRSCSSGALRGGEGG